MTVYFSILAQKLNIFTSCHALFSENVQLFSKCCPWMQNPLERFDHPSSQKEVPQKIPPKIFALREKSIFSPSVIAPFWFVQKLVQFVIIF